MRSFCGSIGLLLALSLVSCVKNKPQVKEVGVEGDSVIVDAAVEEPDSTLYGKSDEFGMSTFTLITDEGDTLNVMRESEDGRAGHMYGDLKYGDRYAMTTCDDGESLDVLINLTQLEKYIKDYDVKNGNLVIGDGPEADTVRIEVLNNRELRMKGYSGKVYQLKPQF